MDESYQLTSTTDLNAGEDIVQSFSADRATYWRDHAWMAAVAMAAGMVILWALGNPHVWTGAIGGLAAIAIRGFYIASDELNVRWDMTNQRLLGPQTRIVPLESIKDVRTIANSVQVITTTGDKYLLKYQADRHATKAAILAAAGKA